MTMPPTGPVLEYHGGNADSSAALRGTLFCTILARVVYIGCGILLPGMSFVIAFGGLPTLGRMWQDGRPQTYAALLLTGRYDWPLYLPVLFAMVSIGALAIAPQVVARRFPFRLGIYSGLPLAVIFAVTLGVVSNLSSGGLALAGILGIVGLVIVLLLAWGLRHLVIRGWPYFPILLGALGIALGLLAMYTWSWKDCLFVLWAHWLYLGPLFTLTVYAAASIEAFRAALPNSRRRWPWWLAWFGLTDAAAILTVHNALTAYAKLPTTPPPGCYIGTAAACGHPRWVGARTVVFAWGAMRVNRQLRVLKAGEIVLATVAPRLHRALRAIYDLVGPLAARMTARHALLADAAYLMLKPAEWTAAAALRALRLQHHAEMLYRSPKGLESSL